MKMNNLNRNVLRLLYLMLIICSLLMMSACDKRSIDPNSVRVSTLEGSSSTLYQDNGATTVVVTAIVKDKDGFPVVGRQVNFRSNYEPVRFLPARCTTDSSGIAKTEVFINGTFPQDSIKVNVDAFLDATYQKSIYLTVFKAPQVTELKLDPTVPSQVPLNGPITVKARAYNSNNALISDGTRIKFTATGGYFVDSYGSTFENEFESPIVNGVATVNFIAGTVAKKLVISAKVGDIEASNPKTVQVLAGTAKTIALTDSTSAILSLPVNTAPVNIEGYLYDEFSNSIAYKVITLTSNIGNITPAVSTDSLGKFIATFNPGSAAGSAKIDIVSDSASFSKMIQITSSEVQYLRFTNNGTISLNVAGAGGVESTPLSVRLYDNSGNVVDLEDQKVKFEFTAQPAGALINGGQSAIVEAYSGLATVSVTSGTGAGPANIKATLCDDNGDPVTPLITVTQSQIIIHAGRPNSIAFTIGGNDTGVDVGSGNYRIIVGAIIRDLYGNPVDKGTGVYFDIADPANAVYADSIAVVAESYVGNLNAVGDSAAGVAYTTMVYHGALSNMPVVISAAINDSILSDDVIILPMQQAVIEIAAIPAHYDWSEATATNPDPPVPIKLKTVVTDGQGNKIRNAKLHFTTTLGFFNTVLYPDDPEDGDGLSETGITAVNGFNIKYLLVNRYECLPPNPDGSPGTNNLTALVRLLGYDNKQATADVILRRYEHF